MSTAEETPHAAPLDEPSPCSMPPGSDAERRYLLAAADHLDRLYAAWTAAGRDPDELAAELRIDVTQACLRAKRQGGAA